MLRSAAFASSLVASMPTVLPLTRPSSGQSLQHPGEDRLVRLQINQATRARNRRMIGRCLPQYQPEKLAQRIGRTPRNRALGVQAFEMANQQQAEVATRRQARAALIRVDPLAPTLDESVEVVLVENLIQSHVEGMRGAARARSWVAPISRPARVPPTFAHCHRREGSTRDRSSH